jgi:hypothetical protein
MNVEDALTTIMHLFHPKTPGILHCELEKVLYECPNCKLVTACPLSSRHTCIIEISTDESQDEMQRASDEEDENEVQLHIVGKGKRRLY